MDEQLDERSAEEIVEEMERERRRWGYEYDPRALDEAMLMPLRRAMWNTPVGSSLRLRPGTATRR